MKNLSIRTAILLPITIILIAGIIVDIAFIGSLSSSTANHLTEEVIRETVNHYAYRLKTDGEKAFSITTSSAHLVEQMRGQAGSRDQIVHAFQDIVSENDEILAIWTVWEPDMFDGRDSFYQNRPYHDETGRFIPYVYRSGGSVKVDPLVDYDDPQSGSYYQQVRKSGRTQSVDPMPYPVDTGISYVYSIASPIVENGQVIGAVGVDVDISQVNESFKNIRILDTGYLTVMNPNGIIVSSPNADRVLKHYSEIPKVYYGDTIQGILHNGGSAIETDYSDYLNAESVLSFQGIKIGLDEGYWLVFAVVPKAAISASSRDLMLIMAIVGLFLVGFFLLAVTLIIGRNLKDLPVLTKAAQALSQGRVNQVDLGGDPGDFATSNEVALLRRAFHEMVETTRQQVQIVQRISQGDLSMEIHPQSPEDLLNNALGEMVYSNNRVFHAIQSSAGTVDQGSMQIAAGAQQLAQGAVEQSASIEQLTVSVQEIAQKTVRNESLAEQAAALSQQMSTIADDGTEHMRQMTHAVSDIDEATQGIQKVIKIIDDIAFQTNILALNAAVEAARAGIHGKGFAVVAEEVRVLSSKSADAAKETGDLIANSMKKTALGTQIAAQTSQILDQIVAHANQSNEIVSQIPASSREQTLAVEQINLGLRHIADAAQENSLTAQSSAATSQDMSEQAAHLRQLVAQFQLKDYSAGTIHVPPASGNDTAFSLHAPTDENSNLQFSH